MAPGVVRAAEPGPQAVAAPHYGDTLFNFFQDRYFSAITGLMVSRYRLDALFYGRRAVNSHYR